MNIANTIYFLKTYALQVLLCVLLAGCGSKSTDALKNNATLSYHGTADCDAETASYGMYRITAEKLGELDAYFSCRSDKANNRWVCANTKDGTVNYVLLVELTNTGVNTVRIDAYSWYGGNYKKWIEAIKNDSKSGRICK